MFQQGLLYSKKKRIQRLVQHNNLISFAAMTAQIQRIILLQISFQVQIIKIDAIQNSVGRQVHLQRIMGKSTVKGYL